jgi:hypothetical protein
MHIIALYFIYCTHTPLAPHGILYSQCQTSYAGLRSQSCVPIYDDDDPK